MLNHAYASITNDPCRDNGGVLRGSRILIVEDEPLMAVDYRFQLIEMGAIPVGYKSTNSAAVDFLAANAVDAVIVDYALRDGTSQPLMRWLLDHGVPFVVITANKPEMWQWTDVVSVLDKPISPRDLRTALCELLASATRHSEKEISVA